jgi:hypothetical protein
MATQEVGGVGTALLFENQQVRVWEMDLAPGESTALHHHEHDYVLVIVQGDKIAAVPAPGTDGETQVAEITPPLVVQIPKGGTETATNVGNERYYELIIELL